MSSSRFDTCFSSWDGGRVGYPNRCCTSDKEVPSASGCPQPHGPDDPPIHRFVVKRTIWLQVRRLST
jgi:hypothetical protein